MDFLARKANSLFFTESEELDAMLLPITYSPTKPFPDMNATIVMGASPPLGASGSFDPSCVGCGTDDSPFLLLLFSRSTLRLLKSVSDRAQGGIANTLIAIDGTFKVTRKGYQTVAVAVLDTGHKAHLLAHVIMSHRSTNAYYRVFSSLRSVIASSNVGVSEDLKWMITMTDAEDALIAGVQQAYGDDVRPLMCWFHVKQAVDRAVGRYGIGSLRASIISSLSRMHYSCSEEMFAVRPYPFRSPFPVPLNALKNDTLAKPINFS